MVAKQQAVARDAAASSEQPQTRPEAHGIVGKDGLAELALETLDDTHRRPIAARHDDGLRLRSVGPKAELVGFLRADASELDRGDESHHLAVDDLEAAHLHELDHRLVHGLAPWRADGDPLDTKARESVDECSRRRGRGPARRILHALDQL